MNAAADRVEEITLRVVVSDPAAESLPDSDRLEVAIKPDEYIRQIPPVKGIEKLIEVRVNNLLLGPARVEGGWLAFQVEARQLAVGDNLVGVRVTKRPLGVRDEIVIEKLELHLKYR